MKKYCCVTIDVERDCGPHWRGSDPVTYRSVLEAIPEIIQPLCEEMGLAPTYLFSAEVLENPQCTKVLKSLADRAEFGTHLHGEFVEPMKTFRGIPYNRVYTAELQSLYPPSLEFQKLSTLTELFKDVWQIKPKSFRAGRFALGPHTLKYLSKLGYLIDTSITPGILWEYEIGTVDFHHYSPEFFWNSLNGQPNAILEVPVTIHPKWGWLRPSKNYSASMIKIVEVYSRQTSDCILNIMFHSMEFTPGASPYAESKVECNRLLNRLRDTLTKAKEMNFIFLTLQEIYKELKIGESEK